MKHTPEPTAESSAEPNAASADVLLIGARGAVGASIAERLRAAGVTVTPAGRTRPSGGISLNTGAGADAASLTALAAAAGAHRVVINASGTENAEIAGFLGGAQLLDISASAEYLAALSVREPSAALVLGVGLAPGLTTALLGELAVAPGDEIDLGIMLGSGEKHGPAAVEWTAGLIGADLAEPAEGGSVRNLAERRFFAEPGARRRRTYLRADFPDHSLLQLRDGQAPLTVRSYLALSSRAMTWSLGLLGKLPRFAGLMRQVPALGDERWRITAVNRRTGESRTAHGVNQSRATAELTAATAIAALRRGPVPGVTLGGDLLDLSAVSGVHLG